MLKDRVPDEESIAVVKQLLFAEYGVSERDQEKMLRESTCATRQAELDERLQDLRQGLAATKATGRQEEVADLQRAILKMRQDALAEERTARTLRRYLRAFGYGERTFGTNRLGWILWNLVQDVRWVLLRPLAVLGPRLLRRFPPDSPVRRKVPALWRRFGAGVG